MAQGASTARIAFNQTRGFDKASFDTDSYVFYDHATGRAYKKIIVQSDVNGLVSALAGKASAATTLAGYGITDPVELTTNKNVANGYAPLDSGAKVPLANLPSAVVGDVQYQGTWNAATNTPALTSGVGTKGQYYKVSVAGTTPIDGLNSWNIGDEIIFDGAAWDRLIGVNQITTVNGYTGVVTLRTSDVAENVNLYYTDARAQAAWGNQNANLVVASPASGGAGAMSVRSLVAADIPALAYVPIAQVTGGGILATGGFTLTVPATGTAALLGVANSFTQAQTVLLAPAANTVVDGLVLSDTTAASAGNQQYSPALHWKGAYFDTGVVATRVVEYRAYLKSAQGPPQSSVLLFEGSNNNGAFSSKMQLNGNGQLATWGGIGTLSYLALSGDDPSGNLNFFIKYVSGGLARLSSDSVNANGSIQLSKVVLSDGGTTFDTALARNAIAVVEINNGTAGQWGALKLGTYDAGTTTNVTGLFVSHNSSGAGDVGLGTSLELQAKTSTTANVKQARLSSSWVVALNGSYTARSRWFVSDFNGEREAVRVEADGSQALLGFYGVNAIARAVLATGAGHTVDDVISALQNLGLVKQS